MKIIKRVIKDKYTVIFGVILIIAILSRVLFLTKFPFGIDQDEAGMMYDAYCMAEYGTDRFLNENPVYLINFGGGQSVMYAAIASLLIKVFGLSVFIVRLPAVVFSIITIILAYLLAKKYIGKKFALILAFLITICPWHIMQSRWGLDCNLFPSFLMISLCIFLNAKKDWHFIISGIFWGLTLYTYALSYVLLPVFFITLCIYLLYVRKITLKQIIITILPIFVLALPLILFQIVNLLEKGTIKIGFITIPQLPRYRVSEIGLSNILYNLDFRNEANFWQILFSAGSNQSHSLKEFGTIYYVLIPFVVFGFGLILKESIATIKKREFNLKTVFAIQFITMALCLLLFKELQTYKLNSLFIMLLVFGAESIVWIFDRKRIIGYCIIVALAISYVIFEVFYFTKINEKIGIGFNSDFIPLVEYLDKEYPDKEIYTYTDALQEYIYLLLAEKMSPYEFNEKMTLIQSDTKEINVVEVGRYHFMHFNLDKQNVYVIEKDVKFRKEIIQSVQQELEKEGFTCKEYGNFLIMSQ